MKRNKILQWFLALLLTTAMTLAYAPMAASWFSYAAAGDTPAHSKSIQDNHDGTYKIELTVTGDADDKTSENAHVNVLLVYDESSSMTIYDAPNSDYSRADWTEDAVYGLMNGLVGYSNQGVDIYAAEVGFGTGSDQRSGWTNNLTTIRGHFDQGVDGQVSNVHQYSSHNGTNWSSAMDRADGLLDGLTNVGGQDRSSYPTFVIFITDGAPTTGGGGGTVYPGPNVAWTEYRNHYNAATADAYSIQSRENVTMYGIYAFGSDANLLDDLMYYSTHGAHRVVNGYSIMTAQTNQHNFGLTESGAEDYYYGAQSTQELLDIIDDIFSQIVEAIGITDVTMNDGTTNQVTVSSGGTTSTVELLGVDEDSYQYWLTIPVDGNNQFKRTINVNNQATEITYTVSNDGSTISWTEGTASKSVTVNGSLSNGQLKYEWTKADDFYDKAPPAAELVDGAVKWELGDEVGVLLSGVTYSVTFDVYPSQTALDYKAKLENGESYNDVVPAEAQDYFNENGELKTNTKATLTYSDTRLENPGPRTADFTNPPAVETESITMDVEKDWEGAEAPTLTDGLKVDVLADGDKEDPFYEATLKSPDWASEFNISCGIIKDGVPLKDAKGHDFSFAELGDEQYRWELHAPVVRPMIINGEGIVPTNEPTMLIKADPENGYDPTGKTQYTIDGATYYVDPAVTSLKATNHRRSNLNLKKVVTGSGAPADAKFPFTLTVNNSKAPKAAPEDDPNHNSDYWVWFSIRDANNQPVTTAANVQSETVYTTANNYFIVKSGAEVTLDMQAGWNLRIINLPTKSTYSFEEGNAANFKFVSAENTGVEDSTFDVDGKTATGTIEKYDDKAYEVTYTNEYALVDVTATKVWNDGSNQDGIRPETLTLTLNGLPTGTTAPTPTITPSTDGNSWTYTWAGVPKYDTDGEVITYTVTEGTVPDGYTCETTTVDAGGTITNVHNPTTTDVTVTKEWTDGSNQDGIRPTDLALTLKANGTDVTSTYADKLAVTKDGDTWTYTWTGLPEKASGQAIAYTVTEGTVPTGYTCETTTVNADGTITNVHNPATTDVTVTKAWDDDSNRDNVRPSDLALTLKANGTDVTSTYADKLSVTKNDNTWTYTWAGLPEKASGQAITYTVTEETVPDGYTCETTTVAADGTITNKHTPEKVTVTVTKVWADQDDKDKLRPSELKLTLNPSSSVSPTVKKDGNTWTYTWSGLPKKAGGVDIEYTVSEENVPAGYTKSPADPVKDGGKITNKHTSTEALIVGLKELKGYDGSIPTGKFKFTIKGISAEYDEGEQASDEQPAEENAAKSSENEAAEQTSDTATEPEAAKPAEEEASKDADAAAEKAEEAGKEAKEAQDTADLAKVEAEEAKNAAAEAAEQGTPEADQLQKAADEAAEKAEETQKAADDAKADADKAQEAADEAKADAEKAQEAADETTADKTAEAEPAQDTAVKEAPASEEKPAAEEKKSLEAAKDVAKAVADAADIPLPKETTVTNNAEGTIEFGKIIYEKAGTYTYEITESGSMANVTNDPEKTKTVVVKVTEDEDGNLQATVEPSDETYKFTFTNTYTEPDPGTCFIDPPVKKVIEGNAPKAAETYTFKLEATASGNPMPAAANGASSMTVNITGEGEKEFGKIIYDKDDAGKTYYYTVREVAGDNSDCEYDSTIYTVSAYIYVDDDGKLQVKREYFKDGNATDVATFEFVNTYESDEPDKGTGVKTGDDSGIMGLLALMSASAAGLAALCVRRRREEQ